MSKPGSDTGYQVRVRLSHYSDLVRGKSGRSKAAGVEKQGLIVVYDELGYISSEVAMLSTSGSKHSEEGKILLIGPNELGSRLCLWLDDLINNA